MIEICNLRNTKQQFLYDIRVDRMSILGNPFRMSKDCKAQRDYVCDLYHIYFTALVKNDTNYMKASLITQKFREDFMNALRHLYKIYQQYGKLRLFCWCAPQRCHAEDIKMFLEKYINN